jgi:mannose-6-phosphate isomerase-like protein (cupin superfamily)
MAPEVKTYIESGILELYVMGNCSESEMLEVTRMAALHPEILQEIERIESDVLLAFTQEQNVPRADVKALVMASIDYSQRLANGETPQNPPLLSIHSKAHDYSEWLSRADLNVLPEADNEVYGRIIGHNEVATTLIAWLKTGSAFEVHEAQLERFLILEGSCKIEYANGETHHLKTNDFLEIPLFMGHTLTVTSDVPCKVILQRVAA